MAPHPKLGLIAGNGSFPLLVLDAARVQGYEVVVAAIKEEASSDIESHGAAAVHWLSLGELSKLIDTFKGEGVTRAVMAGQVKHKQIFSSIRPDWRLAKLLLSLGTRNTDSLLGAVAKVLADEGIILENSTSLLEPLLAKSGVLTKRGPSEQEKKNIEYGRMVCPPSGEIRHWANGCHRGSGVCGGRSHGGHRCQHRTRGTDYGLARVWAIDVEPCPDGGENRQA